MTAEKRFKTFKSLHTQTFLKDKTIFLKCLASFSVTFIAVWLRYTPELQFISIVFISSPLALLVALWGMTSVRALQLMGIGAHRKPALLPQALLNGGLGAAAP